MRDGPGRVDPDALRAAHDAYAAERDAADPADHAGPRPSGGVGRHPHGREVPARPLRATCSPAATTRSVGGPHDQLAAVAVVNRVAAVDIGTNSVRLLVAEVDGPTPRDAKVVPLDRRMRITRLGQGVDRTRALAPEAIDRTTAVLREYRAALDEHGVTQVRATATSAARDATNRDEFFTAAHDALGVTPELLSGEEEAALSFLGATADLDAPAPYLVVDIGGGSTEFVLGTDAPVGSGVARHGVRAHHRAVPALRSARARGAVERGRGRARPRRRRAARDPRRCRRGDARRSRRHRHDRRRDRARASPSTTPRQIHHFRLDA